jgi:oligoendopeptidase F
MPNLQQTWDNRHFYANSADPRIATTVEELKGAIATLATTCATFNARIETAETLPESEFDALITQVRTCHEQRTAIAIKLSNLYSFIGFTLSVNAHDAPASAWKPTLQQLNAEFSQATKALDVFLTRVPDGLIDRLIQDPILNELSFSLKHERQLKDQLLSLPAEKLITGLAVTGLISWGNLYTELAGSLTCDVNGETMGLTKAFNLQSSADRPTREAAWNASTTAWSSQSGTVANILNAINGWRLEETKQRGTIRHRHYLDQSCHQSRIDRATLDAMMDSTYDRRSIGQRALKTMGKVLQIDAMQPWDLFAPPPAAGDSESISFDAAIELIANAFSQLTPEMGRERLD